MGSGCSMAIGAKVRVGVGIVTWWLSAVVRSWLANWQRWQGACGVLSLGFSQRWQAAGLAVWAGAAQEAMQACAPPPRVSTSTIATNRARACMSVSYLISVRTP